MDSLFPIRARRGGLRGFAHRAGGLPSGFHTPPGDANVGVSHTARPPNGPGGAHLRGFTHQSPLQAAKTPMDRASVSKNGEKFRGFTHPGRLRVRRGITHRGQASAACGQLREIAHPERGGTPTGVSGDQTPTDGLTHTGRCRKLLRTLAILTVSRPLTYLTSSITISLTGGGGAAGRSRAKKAALIPRLVFFGQVSGERTPPDDPVFLGNCPAGRGHERLGPCEGWSASPCLA